MNEKQEKAFELYYSMGNQRSLDKLAQKIKVSAMTVRRWSEKYEWQRLIKERDKSDAELLKEEVIEAKRLFLRAIAAGSRQVLSDIENGSQKVKVEDFIQWGSPLGNFDIGIADGVGTQPAGVNNEVTETTVTKVIKFAPFHKE